MGVSFKIRDVLHYLGVAYRRLDKIAIFLNFSSKGSMVIDRVEVLHLTRPVTPQEQPPSPCPSLFLAGHRALSSRPYRDRPRRGAPPRSPSPPPPPWPPSWRRCSRAPCCLYYALLHVGLTGSPRNPFLDHGNL
jgi:hypothetical protein